MVVGCCASGDARRRATAGARANSRRAAGLLSALADIWRLFDACERRRLRLLLVLIVCMGAATLAGVLTIVPFFAVLGDPRLAAQSRLLQVLHARFTLIGPHADLQLLGIAFLASVWLANLINWSGARTLNRFAQQVGDRLSNALFEEYLHRDLAFHRGTNSAALLSHVMWEVRTVALLLQGGFTLATHAVSGALILACVVLVDFRLAAALLLVLAASYGLFYAATRARLQRNGVAESAGNALRARVAAQGLGGVKEITVLRSQGMFAAMFAQATRSTSAAAASTHGISIAPRYLLECGLTGFLLLVALAEAGDDAGSGAWLSRLSFLGFSAYRLLPSLQQIFHAAVRIKADRAAFDRVAADLRAATHAPARRSAATVTRAPLRQAIEIQDVSFRHEPSRPWTLRRLSLRIPAGSLFGLAGASGAGKSTLVELLLGLNTPASGSVLLDGVVLVHGECAGWHAQVGYVPQEIFIFDATLAQNVALALPGTPIDAPRLQRALQRAQLGALVAELPHGIDEPVGERGTRLSGGQRQRIGIARALYRESSVLILDEATNALDAATEADIMGTLRELRGTHTIVCIAHRPGALRLCDSIAHLEQGSIVSAECGAGASAQSAAAGRG
jgi:ATP-binding cassette, subfamily B, bacterial PglK